MATLTRKPKHGGRRRGAGRPPAPGARSARLVVRMQPAELDAIATAAAAVGLSVPDYVRQCLARCATTGATNTTDKGGIR